MFVSINSLSDHITVILAIGAKLSDIFIGIGKKKLLLL